MKYFILQILKSPYRTVKGPVCGEILGPYDSVEEAREHLDDAEMCYRDTDDHCEQQGLLIVSGEYHEMKRGA